MVSLTKFKKLLFLTLQCTIFFTSIASSEPNSVKTEGIIPGNAVWIWDKTKSLVNNRKERERLFAFCKKPHGEAAPITTLFLYAGWKNFLKENAQKIREFLKEAHKNGIKVHSDILLNFFIP